MAKVKTSWLVDTFLNEKASITLEKGRYKNKRVINLSNLNLSTLIPKQIDQLRSSTYLRCLYLQKNQLEELPYCFGSSLCQLEVLALDYNQLTDLPDSITNLINLKFLNISNNDFSLNGFPQHICSLVNLQKLWANNIKIKYIPDGIHQLKKLKILGLRNNYLEETPSGLFNLGSLKWLTLENNKIKEIPLSFSRLKNIIHINFNYNNISRIPNIWDQLPMLTSVSLRLNELNVDNNLKKQFDKIPKVDLSGNPRSFTSSYQQNSMTSRIKNDVQTKILWRNGKINRKAAIYSNSNTIQGAKDEDSSSSTDEDYVSTSQYSDIEWISYTKIPLKESTSVGSKSNTDLSLSSNKTSEQLEDMSLAYSTNFKKQITYQAASRAPSLISWTDKSNSNPNRSCGPSSDSKMYGLKLELLQNSSGLLQHQSGSQDPSSRLLKRERKQFFMQKEQNRTKNLSGEDDYDYDDEDYTSDSDYDLDTESVSNQFDTPSWWNQKPQETNNNVNEVTNAEDLFDHNSLSEFNDNNMDNDNDSVSVEDNQSINESRATSDLDNESNDNDDSDIEYIEDLPLDDEEFQLLRKELLCA